MSTDSYNQDLEKGVGSSSLSNASNAGLARKTTTASFRHDRQNIYINDLAIDKEEFLYAFGGDMMVGRYKETPNHKKYANPVPSGLAAFSSTVLTLGCIQMHARSVTHANILIAGLLTTSGLVELIVGVLCFVIGNTWATSTFLLFGGFYSSYGLVLMNFGDISGSYTDTQEYNMSIGFYLLPWAIFSFALWITTFRSTWELFLLMFFVWMFIMMFVIGQFITSVAVYKAGGFFCIMAGIFGYYNMYCGMADKSNSFLVPKPLYLPKVKGPEEDTKSD